MCCFTGPVGVSDTNIFVRASSSGTELLVYSMTFKAAEDLAMVLPLPVPLQAGEKAVRFIDLSRCTEFFVEMESGFPPQPWREESVTLGFSYGGVRSNTLEVQRVGSFDASFVPTLEDFSRLDPRFRLPREVWAGFRHHRDYGFAVFQLRATGAQAATVHPMAFEFPRLDPSALFFPTVHIHDGVYHPTARFHHNLYMQSQEDSEREEHLGFEVSRGPARSFMSVGCLAGIVDGESHLFRRELVGALRNADVSVRRGRDGRLELRLGESGS